MATHEDLGFIPNESHDDLGFVPDDGAGQAALHGAAQGVSFGLSDELQAALGTAGYRSGLPEGMNDELSLPERYRQIREEVRAKEQGMEKQHPGPYLAGGLGGGLLTGGLVKNLPKDASILQKILHGGKIGAVSGAATGLGASEADLTKGELGEAAKDVGLGTIVGGGLGVGLSSIGAIPGAVRGAGKLAKKAALDTEIGSDVGEAYTRGTKGELLAGKSARRKVGEEMVDYSEKLYAQLKDKQGDLGKAVEGVIQEAEEQGQTIDLAKLLDAAKEQTKKLPQDTNRQVAEKKELGKFINKILRGTDKTDEELLEEAQQLAKHDPLAALESLQQPGPLEGGVAPQRAVQISRSAKQLTDIGEEALQTPEAKRLATGLSKNIQSTTRENIAGLSEADAKYAAIKRAQEALGFEDILSNENIDKAQKAAQILNKLESETTSSDIARKKAKEVIKYLKEADPLLAKEVETKMQDISSRYDLARKASREGFGGQGLLGAARARAISVSNLAGKGVNSLRQATPEKLKNLAESFSSKGKIGTYYANSLLKASQLEDVGMRNAIIFTLEQQPEFRQMLTQESGVQLQSEPTSKGGEQ